MNTQPTRAPQEDPLPSTWNTKWYRFRFRLHRLSARLLGMPSPHDVNKALKNEYWRGFHDAREHYLGHCPAHPEELTLETGSGFRKCCLCWNENYFRSLDSGPITDPHMMPATRYTNMRERGAGPYTAATRAVVPNPKRLITRSLQPPKEG